MSALAESLLPGSGAPAGRRTPLRLVPPGRSRARRAPFVAVVLALLAAGLLGMLALHTVLAQDAFRLHELRVQGKELADREQALLTAVESLQAPRAVAERARSLGMVPGGPPVFLQLPEGTVLGAGSPGLPPTPDLVGAGAVPAAPPLPGQAPASDQQPPAASEVTR